MVLKGTMSKILGDPLAITMAKMSKPDSLVNNVENIVVFLDLKLINCDNFYMFFCARKSLQQFQIFICQNFRNLIGQTTL